MIKQKGSFVEESLGAIKPCKKAIQKGKGSMLEVMILGYYIFAKLFPVIVGLYLLNLCLGVFLKKWKTNWWNRAALILLGSMTVIHLYQNFVLGTLQIEIPFQQKELPIFLFLFAMILQYQGYRKIKLLKEEKGERQEEK